MTVIDKVIQLAKGEVGYLEKASNSNLDNKTSNAGDKNFTKYARDLDKIKYFNGAKNGYAWCSVFVHWLLVQVIGKEKALEITGEPSINNYGAGCAEVMSYFNRINRFYKSPQVGDFIIFKNSKGTPYHIGLVTGFDNNKVYTIEGNTSSASGVVDNGGAVASKSYNLNYSAIAGYCRPLYEKVKMEDDEVVDTTKIEINGVEYTVNRILKDGKNYVELSSLKQTGINVEYDNVKKIPKLDTIPTSKTNIKINNEIKNVDRVLKNGTNYVKIRDLESKNITISNEGSTPIVTTK